MQKGNKADAVVIARFLRTLGLGAEVAPDGRAAGRAVAVATAAGKRYTFLPIGVSALTGSGVEQVVREAGRTSSQAPARVVVARTLSPRVRGELDAAEVSWVDHEGAGRIVVTPGLYLARAVEGARQETPRTLRWSYGSGAVAEALLTLRSHEIGRHRTRSWVIPPLDVVATASEISGGQVSRILTRFDLLGWTSKSGTARGSLARRTLDDPASLLDSWATWHRTRRLPSLLGHALVRDPLAFATERLAPHLPDGGWCLTGYAAAAVVAPFTTALPSLVCYLDRERLPQDWSVLLQALDLRRVTSGESVRLVAAEPHVLLQASRASQADLPTAAPVRIYADVLAAGGVRADEVAQHLRETTLGY